MENEKMNNQETFTVIKDAQYVVYSNYCIRDFDKNQREALDAAIHDMRKYGALMESNVSDGAAHVRARNLAYAAISLAKGGRMLEAYKRLGEAEGYVQAFAFAEYKEKQEAADIARRAWFAAGEDGRKGAIGDAYDIANNEFNRAEDFARSVGCAMPTYVTYNYD